MSKPKPEHTMEQFKADLEAELAITPDGAQAAPFDGSKLRKLVRVLDDAADKFAPVISTLTPAQYRIFLDLAVKLINAVDDRVNPDVTPAA